MVLTKYPEITYTLYTGGFWLEEIVIPTQAPRETDVLCR